MTYSLKFEKRALKEWEKLGHPIREQFKKKLSERLENPHISSARLSGRNNLYKIKLCSSGYRLVYEVNDHAIVLLVIAVGKRSGNQVYSVADERE
ncbi:type II toxin-antitoxin system RelE/ParE family toxin [Xenorhabdus nematophila]|uniref:Qin prophage part of two-component toxin-antitoxin system with RelB, transcriptional corepressor of relBE operon n=1 Tax=Xenorhabdus nematophila (strain ATCC 19061 / DSM 3370 / CCUG 14189 / LMG 1036 / NCIMB 9965 / AN6) TaxID=406817 RepID=D3VJU1_XENNA|nr:type II toxin-antitoxin system RelE/ParE family toxin [Xenorhabdus nematophila]CEE90360.1 RelE-like protein (RelBE toxin-antitoxin system) [Xenorhabdus nematophila str. Anatoliense]CBJ91000.1 Qin prophage; part of two-component toxin-antitoxin system with RelB, transcriptional corepressor of relBE operon [Xenorhabdus nematophila ATCC 19061]CCW31880.1 mRNA interferase RelE [Xenorhabdus nematophila F1]CEE91556.1 RelE-like protein (RelBE toxin-antitoxin system) [Xenorhabdus nematophila str. Ana